jgi:hypothetical protein
MVGDVDILMGRFNKVASGHFFLIEVGILEYTYQKLGIGRRHMVVPPLLAASVGLLPSRSYAAPLAYIGGSLGTLIGADLMNINKLQGLGAPIVSIGGAMIFGTGVASGVLGTMRLTGQMFSMGVTLLLFALYIGGNKMAPEYYPVFLKCMKMAFIISASLCFLGIFASIARGRTRRPASEK